MLDYEGITEQIILKGGVIGGDNNAGKCRVISQLIYEAQCAEHESVVPSYLKKLNKTLIIWIVDKKYD